MHQTGPMGPSRMMSKPVIAAVSSYAVAEELELLVVRPARWPRRDAVRCVAVAGEYRSSTAAPCDARRRAQPRSGHNPHGRGVPADEAPGHGLANRVVPKGPSPTGG